MKTINARQGSLVALLDGGTDVDIDDVAVFQACMTGADILGDPNCAAGP